MSGFLRCRKNFEGGVSIIDRVAVSRSVRNAVVFLMTVAVCASISSASQSAWRKLNFAHSPSPRVNMVMASDPVGKNIVMFGGYDGTSATVGLLHPRSVRSGSWTGRDVRRHIQAGRDLDMDG